MVIKVLHHSESLVQCQQFTVKTVFPLNDNTIKWSIIIKNGSDLNEDRATDWPI